MRLNREKIFTKNDTKITKFGVEIIRTSPVLRAFVVIESVSMSESIDTNS